MSLEPRTFSLGEPTSPHEVRLDHLDRLLEIEGARYRANFADQVVINNRTLTEIKNQGVTRLVLTIHKMLFITGGDDGNVMTALDPWDNPIYTKQFRDGERPNPESLDFHLENPFKQGEVAEAEGEIAKIIRKVQDLAKKQGVEPREVDLRQFLTADDLGAVMSEMADVVFNLVNIDVLDPNKNYDTHIMSICESLGYSFQQGLYLAWFKYHMRMVTNDFDKQIGSENEAIADLMRRDILPTPNIGQLSMAVTNTVRIREKLIEPKLIILKEEVEQAARTSRSVV